MLRQDTVWLNRQQIARLFGRDVKTIGKHISNALQEELAPIAEEADRVVAKFATTAEPENPTVAKFATVQKDRFLIADSAVYHVGASLKDLGKSLFAFSRLVTPASTILAQVGDISPR